MIEIKIKDFLKEKLNIPVLYEEPKEEIKSYIVIEKISAAKNNLLSSSVYAFKSYANSLYEAMLLNEKLKSNVELLITLDDISSVKLNSDYNFTDTETKKYRYQAVFDIYHY